MKINEITCSCRLCLKSTNAPITRIWWRASFYLFISKRQHKLLAQETCKVASPQSVLLHCLEQQSLPVANHTSMCCATNPESLRNEQTIPGDLQAAGVVGFCLLHCDTFSERPLFFSRPLFTLDSASLGRRNLDTAPSHGNLRHPVKLSWKSKRGQRYWAQCWPWSH